ncbi:hypothetical protein [Campylobacter sp. RM16187]|uniref:hypothetical protein n=1 Tax=Campylobacter sp. RM16187 TaxID=1660063 RepID=UPI0021B62614|nr:hypothetical protein [Campylobacter sp. RM16187]QKG30285.1 hypothetical protein CDOMF_a036 [Campylobacter sp. RM16187]
MIDLQQEYANQNNPAMQIVKKTATGTKNIFSAFSENCKNVMANLDQKKIDVNVSDSINDKTLFAFLADILKSFKGEKNELLKELKRNEELTKQKLDLVLKEELRENNFLTAENKKNIERFLDTQVGSEITNEILAKKITQINNFTEEAQKRGMPQADIQNKLDDPRFSIRPSDVVSIDLQNKAVKDTVSQASELVKKAVLKK